MPPAASPSAASTPTTRSRKQADSAIERRSVPSSPSNSFSNTRVGWTVGGGIDYAITNNWSVFAEYRYTNFGTLGPRACHCSICSSARLAGAFLNANRTFNQNQVQVGFSYKFDMLRSSGPIVAKY